MNSNNIYNIQDQEKNQQQRYQVGADKRKRLFNVDSHGELDHIKNKIDDDHIEILPNQRNLFVLPFKQSYQSDIKQPINVRDLMDSTIENYDDTSNNPGSPTITMMLNCKFQQKQLINIHLVDNTLSQSEGSQYKNMNKLQEPDQVFSENAKDPIDSPVLDNQISSTRQDGFQNSNFSLLNYNSNFKIGQSNITNNNNNSIVNNNSFYSQGLFHHQNERKSSYMQQDPIKIINSNIFNKIQRQMRKMNIVRQFFQRISNLSVTYITKQLKDEHYKLINDLSYEKVLRSSNKKNSGNSSNNQEQKNKSYIPFRNFLLFLTKIPIIQPESLFCVLWDIVYGLSVLVYLFFIPINISFKVEQPYLTLIIIIIQIVNVALSFNKGFDKQGHIIIDRKQIVLNYIKHHFFIDIIIIIILRFYHNVCWIFFINIRKLQYIVSQTDNYFQIARKYPTLYQMSHLVISILLIGQITGCGFHLIASLENEWDPNSKTWLELIKFDNNQIWSDKYIASEYFAFITMITVGYGDIYPITTAERIYVIFMTIVSSGVFGYVMNTIGSIFKHRAKLHSQHLKRKQDITSYMNDRNIDRSIQTKIQKYLDYQSSILQMNNHKIEILFKDIPKNLTSEIYQEYFGKFLFSNKVLSLNFSKESLIELSLTIKEKFLSPNEFLIQKGEYDQRVFFLLQGSLDVIIDSTNTLPIVFEEIQTIGQCIGLKNAISGFKHSLSIKSSENTGAYLCYFEMNDFKEILRKNQKDYEQYCEIKDEITFSQYNLDTKCISCKKYSHLIENCPLIHPNISKYNTILKFNQTSIQERRSDFKRKTKIQKYSFRKNQFEVRLTARKIRIQMSIGFFPNYQQMTDQLLSYQDEDFLNQLPAFTRTDGDTVVIYEEEEEDEEDNYHDIYSNDNTNKNLNQDCDKDDQIYYYDDQSQKVQEINEIPSINCITADQFNKPKTSYKTFSQLEGFKQMINYPISHNQNSNLYQDCTNQQTIYQQNSIVSINNQQAPSQIRQSLIFCSSLNPSDNVDGNFSSSRDTQTQDNGQIIQAGYERKRDKKKVQYKKEKSNVKYSSFQEQSLKYHSIKNFPTKLIQGPAIEREYQTSLFLNFDIMRSYRKYYPHGNSDVIIKKINQIQQQKKIRQIKNHRSSQVGFQGRKRMTKLKSQFINNF